MEGGQELTLMSENKMSTFGHLNHTNREPEREKFELSSVLDVRDFELINEKFEVIRRPSMLPKNQLAPSDDPDEHSEMFKDMPLTEETTCGLWCFKSSFLQKFANKKVYVLLYGLLGCFNSATYAYFNGTITSLEKRFRISSRTTGLISVGNDISQIFISVFLSYYAGKGHRPRWIAFGMYTVVLFCLLTALPHALYGPGEDSLQHTVEYGGQVNLNDSETFEFLEKQKRKSLCHANRTVACMEESQDIYPTMILFVAQLIGGVGGSVYYSLGVTYMDDNIQKSKTPVLISFAYFLRMLGPAIGYALASFCLKLYVSPNLHPTINLNDPRWLGAWWLGWLILGGILAFLSALIALFPKTLPRAAVRRAIALEKNKGQPQEPETKPSMKDMMKTIKRLMKNKTYVYNNLASIFYCIGYMPYWIFMPKYIETQYKLSASYSSFVTGTVGLIFSAIGVVLSGIVISRYKPRARILAAWNMFIGVVSVLGMISYMYLGCDNPTELDLSVQDYNVSRSCNIDCKCDYVSYSPVCSEHHETFISPCHAGCTNSYTIGSNKKIFTDCSCVQPNPANPFANMTDEDLDFDQVLGKAISGSCPLDCTTAFHIFLGVVCMLKFFGATGRSSNFLVGVRCVDEKDKPVAMGFSVTVLSLFAFVPSPIFFGYILDTTCMVWGKTCTGTGNCWLYDGYNLRYVMNIIAALLIAIGTFFDGCVWYYVKNLLIFDDEVKIKAVGTGD
ncbi:hypothetical protein RUM43_012178 [Polyplax serrata]|uniref:Solute carrier organic anion transporter family member n=1 Tax=Polyplax serrata TaxID=468196 RepID=A0AAN8S7B2_POLSC